MPNLSEFEQFAIQVKSLVNQPVYHDEFVYPGIIVRQAGRRRVQITPCFSEAVQFLQTNPIHQQDPETRPTANELELSPVTARFERNAIHVESLGKSMCLVTIPGDAKMQVIDGGDWWNAALQRMRTDPDAVASQQVLLTLVFEDEN